MSVEGTHSTSHKASAGHEARAARGRPGAPADADAQGAAGFLSILSSLGDAGTDDGGIAGAQDLQVSDPNTLTAAGLLPPPDATKDEPALDTSVLLAQGAQLQGQAQVARPEGAGADATKLQGALRAREGASMLPAVAQDAEAGVPMGRKPGLALGRDKDKKNPLPEQASAVAQAATQKDMPKDVRQVVAMEIEKALQPVQALVQTAIAEVARSEKRSDERTAFAVGPMTDSGAGAAAGVGANDPGFNLAAPTAAAAPAEVQVAEQVHYWISQDVQNAEMKLDGLGETPVEVSIRMQGNEAHVAFRSDESATRSILQGAEGHLKDMLQREGLQLGGVYVGGSGTQGQNGSGQPSGDRRPREGVRTARIAPAGLEPLNVPRQTTTSQRAVDLFV